MSEVITEYSEFLESTPAHWNRVKMQEVGRIVSGGTPSRDAPSLWGGGIPWVTPGELTSLTTKEIHETAKTISAAGLSGSGANLLPSQSLLITSRATLGARAVNSVPMATNQGFKSLVPFNKQMIDFLYHLVDKIKPEMVRRASGTTFLEISGSEFADIDLSMPPTDEAVRIAEILDTLDAAIRGTEAVVAKLKAMKQGLLHDLLTRGIDANGDLRPPHPEAPHLYKQTPLGWLPKEWDEVKVNDLAQSSAIGPFGSDLVASDYRSEGVPVVFVRDIKPDAFIWKSNVFLDARKALSLAAHKVTSGDVVATKMGFPPCIAAVYPADLPDAVITADVVCIRPKLNLMRPEWLSIMMNSPLVRRQVDQITAGVTRPKVTLRDVRELKIALPLLDEQVAILQRATAVDGEIGKNTAMLDKLRLQKSGLMDDLLTGRTPVTALL